MELAVLEKTDRLHHAYIVVGEAQTARTLRMLESRGVQTAGNPDVLALSFSELLVDDVRDTILSFAALKPLSDRKYAVIAFSRANDPSQNALLKAVEESLGKTVFFFCVESAGHLLPTLRSRCISVEDGEWRMKGGNNEAEEFLKAAYAERLVAVDAMTNALSKTQNRAPIRTFVKELLRVARAKKFTARSVRDILDASQYLRMQGNSPKAVLSHLAVSLPRMETARRA